MFKLIDSVTVRRFVLLRGPDGAPIETEVLPAVPVYASFENYKVFDTLASQAIKEQADALIVIRFDSSLFPDYRLNGARELRIDHTSGSYRVIAAEPDSATRRQYVRLFCKREAD